MDNVYQIMEFQHVKPGKGSCVRYELKLKNVINGGVVEKTFRPTEKFPAARIDRVDMQYLYSDGDLYNFMDVNTYEQVALNHGDNRRCTQVRKRERDVQDLFLQRQGILRRTAAVRRA